MRLTFEHSLTAAAIVVGLMVGVGIIGSGAAVPGCAAEQCQPPRNVQKPTSVLECPSGTLCYQGACVPSCASGAERVEKCESDDDCSSAVRPNCVERRCSACNTGERCIPALDICSPIRASDSDAGEPILDGKPVPGVTPLDGGAIDGSSLNFDAGVDPVVVQREVTHLLSINVTQRTNLTAGDTVTSTIQVVSLDVRGTGRVLSATVAPPEFDFTHECSVRTLERYATTPRGADLGIIQIQRDQGPEMHAAGLVANYVATFLGGRYVISPPVGNVVLVFSSQALVRSFEISGAGMPGVTAGRFPSAGDAPDTFVPDIFNLTVASRAALRSIDARDPNTVIVLSWEKGIPLAGGRVLVEVRNSACVLACNFIEQQNTQLRISPTVLDQFRGAPCNATGTMPIFVDRSVGNRVPIDGDPGAMTYFSGQVEARNGFRGQIVF